MIMPCQTSRIHLGEPFVQLNDSSSTTSKSTRRPFRSKSLDDLRLRRPTRRKRSDDDADDDDDHVSNTTRTEMDLTGIGCRADGDDDDDDDVENRPHTNDDYDLQLPRSRSAPVSPTQFYDKELAAFIQCEQQQQQMMADSFVYNIDLSDTNENGAHQTLSRAAIFFVRLASFPLSLSLAHTHTRACASGQLGQS